MHDSKWFICFIKYLKKKTIINWPFGPQMSSIPSKRNKKNLPLRGVGLWKYWNCTVETTYSAPLHIAKRPQKVILGTKYTRREHRVKISRKIIFFEPKHCENFRYSIYSDIDKTGGQFVLHKPYNLLEIRK